MRRHGRLVGILATVLLAGCASAGPEDAPAPAPELSGAQAAPGQGGGITLGGPLPHGGCQAVLYWWCHPRIYVVEANNDRIVRMDDMDGAGWTTYPRERISGLIQKRFARPFAVYITRPTNLTGPPNSQIFVADQLAHRIVRMDDMTGAGWTELGTEGPGVMQFSEPLDVHFDKQGRIYVADSGNNRIVRVNDMTGAGWTVLDGDVSDPARSFRFPSSLVVDNAGRIYFGDVQHSRIVRVDDMSGAGWVTYGTAGSGVGQFAGPVITLGGGHIYVADHANERIVRIDDEMSGEGWIALDTSEFGSPSRVFVRMGRIYVTFWASHDNVVRFDNMSGAGAKLFSACCTRDQRFSFPTDIFVR